MHVLPLEQSYDILCSAALKLEELKEDSRLSLIQTRKALVQNRLQSKMEVESLCMVMGCGPQIQRLMMEMTPGWWIPHAIPQRDLNALSDALWSPNPGVVVNTRDGAEIPQADAFSQEWKQVRFLQCESNIVEKHATTQRVSKELLLELTGDLSLIVRDLETIQLTRGDFHLLTPWQ